MIRDFSLEGFIITLIVLVLSVSLHEFGHAIAADRLGDPGPRKDGRITLWPDKHFDMMGFVMMVLTLLAGFGLGWGKPVMVDPYYFRNKRRDMILVAIAGPIMNLFLAVLFGLLMRLGITESVDLVDKFAQKFLLVNLGLMFFNLIPIHPLDGGKIMSGLLPRDLSTRYDATMWQWGPIILLTCCMIPSLNVFRYVIGPAVVSSARLILGI
jgi:Zn-dependent protease